VPSRLNRVLLINTRTSGKIPSGAINELNPQGGAAVTGENSVGKTTTQQIFALFLGSRPSHIVEAGSGNLPQLQFVLPTPQSAIVFEYQRGEGEDSTRCVAIRRASNGDGADYRFFKGPFREEFFLSETADGKRVFVDDVGFMEQARRHGVSPERILSTPEYCSVILGAPTNTKRGVALRAMSTEYSYGKKRLQHLDRLVAAMVKERIDFRDFINVALSIVEESIGRKAEGQVRKLPQGKKQISLWLENVDACKNAIKQDSEVEKLRVQANTYEQHETQLRSYRADVQHLTAENGKRTKEANTKLGELKKTRDNAVAVENKELGVKESAANMALNERRAAEALFETENAAHQSFINLPIETVIENVNSLPSLRSELATLKSRIKTASGELTDIGAQYDALISQAQTDCQSEISDLNRSLPQILETCNIESKAIQGDKKKTLDDHDESASAIESQLEEAEGSARDAFTRAEMLTQVTQPSDKAMAALNQANEKLNAHRQKELKDQQDLNSAASFASDALVEFNKADAAVRSAVAARESAIQSMRDAQKNLAPDDGSLLAALRAHGGQEWKSDLARVIDPALLHRNDLSPMHVGVGQEVYGWSLVTDNIDSPSWTDDETLRAAVRRCDDEVKTANEKLQEARNQLKIASAALERANAEKSQIESKVNVNKTTCSQLGEAVELAKGRLEKEVEVQKAKNAAQLEIAEKAFKQASSAKSASKRNAGIARKEIETGFDRQLSDCNARRVAAEKRVSDRIAERGKALLTAIDTINAQRMEHLKKEGIDAELVSGLGEAKTKLEGKIRAYEDKQSTVDRWNAWKERVGPVGLDRLSRAAQIATDAHKSKQKELDDHREEMERTHAAYESSTANLNEKIELLGQDAVTLRSLDDRLSLYHATGASLIDSETKPSDLKAKVVAMMGTVESLEFQISKMTRSIREALTGRNNSIQQQIQHEMAESGDQSIVKRALDLCQAHSRSLRDTIAAVQSETHTILGGIMQYQKDISLFKSEVASFDKKLSEGLEKVSAFKRVRDLQIHFAADFDSLDFIKKLDTIEGVSKVQMQESATWGSRDLPNKNTVDALRDFMSLLSTEGTLEVDYAKQIIIRGSAEINGEVKHFKRESELAKISSNGLTAIIFITLLSGMANMIRGDGQIYIPWVTDEIGKFDPGNFHNLMQMLRDNHIDVVTASPALTIAEFRHFARCYRFGERGSISRYKGGDK